MSGRGARYQSPFQGLLRDLAAGVVLPVESGASGASAGPRDIPSDDACLAAAAQEADRGVGRTAPNPPVGAVVVREDHVVGVGFHARAGERHGEVVALDEAGTHARGATLYVTLEPCNHQGRTGPCTERILREGVRRVVVGAPDPNPRVPGGGAQYLRSRGVEVTWATGALAHRCEALIAPFASVAARARPWVVAKVGATLDGRIAAASGESRWITGEASRSLVHRLRDRVDAILVGAATVLSDDPALTTRLPAREGGEGRNPLRVIVDRDLQVPTHARVYQMQPGDAPGAPRALVLHGADADPSALRALQAGGIDCAAISVREGRLDLEEALRQLAARGVMSVLVEPGAALFRALVTQGLVDECWWFSAPLWLGDGGKAALGVLPGTGLGDALRLEPSAALYQVEDDALWVGRIARAAAR